MDIREAVLEECGIPGGDIHCDLSKIEYRDYAPHTDLKKSRYIIAKYWDRVNRKDLMDTMELEVKGQKTSLLKVDSKVLQLVDDGIKIRLALIGEDVVGFMLYRIAFDTLLAIDGMYVLDGFRKHGIGRSLINSLEKPIKKIFFQTHLKNRPGSMFKALEALGCDIKKIARDGDLITWESNWGVKHGD